LATQTMMQLGLPLNRVLRSLRDVRAERYTIVSGYFPGATDIDDSGDDQPRLHTVHLGPEAASVGETVGSLNLEALGVRVSAVRRMGTREVNPAPETRLQAGDVVVLLGRFSQLARAEIRLLQG